MVLGVLLLSLQGVFGSVIAQDATPANQEVVVETADGVIETEEITSPEATAEECTGVVEYARFMIMLGSSLAAGTVGLPSTTVAEWSDEAYTKLIDALTEAISELTGVTPPEAAQKLNEYAIQALEAIQSVVVFLRTSGVDINLPFADKLDQADSVIESIITTLVESCPALESEIDTPVASPTAG